MNIETSATLPAPENTAPVTESENTAPNGEPDIEPERLDADAVRVLLRLRQHGHEAYLVGGCVRDLLIGREPKDFDIATSATPNQVKSLFRNCRLIGRRFRLAHVYFKGGKILEVSTFRAMPTIVEEPQPSEVQEGDVLSEGTENIAAADAESVVAVELGQEVPTAPVADVQDEVAPAEPDLLITEDNTFGTPVQDARRRDFTINGLFYDPSIGRVIDYVNGLRDLSRRELRTIGDPEVRLREDPVRILRAVRFAGKLGFDIESRTYAAMEGAVEDLPRCSAPRLLEETFRLLRGGHARPALHLTAALDALKTLLPPVYEYLDGQEAEGVAEYWRFVESMDESVRGGANFDDSMLLASILLPISLDEPDQGSGDEENGKPPSVAQAIEQLLSQLVQKARLPRRIAERCRMILMAQRTLAGLRRRRGGLMGFRGHPLFNESLAVFEVWVRATGEHKDQLEKWKAGGAPTPTSDAPGPKRRRRRRRRGAGGQPGAEATSGGAETTAAPAAPPPSAE
ncbi:MAG: poly(A) polymerase [Archangium gephyra]|uniref:Poly(A) polymerase I n=1 Tax=Archangium gephyra TaxID=48 RepID=A0A2W5T4B9_9BACT|nr:MAG: poly(A) polymerase [Archangium gephyra]